MQINGINVLLDFIMKKIFLFCAILLVTCLSFNSCNQVTPDNGDDNTEEPVVEPLLTVASGNQLSVAYDAKHASFNYELLNGVENGRFEVEKSDDAEWIKNIGIESFSMSGVVSFDVEENRSVEPRNAILHLNYIYDTTKVVSAAINVVQDALDYKYSLEINAVQCLYYGNIGTSFYEYEIRMGKDDYEMTTTGAEYYSLTFLCSNGTQTRLPEPGLYPVVSAENEEDHTIKTDGWSVYMKVDDLGEQYETVVPIVDGWINVSKDGDIYIFEGFIMDAENKWHKIYYDGSVVLWDRTIASTLTGDVETDLNEMVVEAHYNGNAFGTGSVWMMVIYKDPKSVGDITYQIQLIAPVSVDMSTGFPDMTFLPDETGLYDPNTFTKGTESAISYNGSWVYTFTKYDEKTQMYYVGNPAGPFIDGVVDVKLNPDGTYDINIDIEDDANHTIKAAGENIAINFYDNTIK